MTNGSNQTISSRDSCGRCDRRGVNVAQVVRDYKSQHKRAKPKAIAKALGSQGTKVSPQHVSTILSVWRRKKGRKAKRAADGGSDGVGIDVVQLVKAKTLVQGSVGSIRPKR